MKICVIVPSSQVSTSGNRITARRWARILRSLGHRVTTQTEYDGTPCHLLLALHARKSYPSARRFRALYPDLPLVVALTGTDLYRDLPQNVEARHALELATRLVVLQTRALSELPEAVRSKTHVIFQSADPLSKSVSVPSTYFRICVMGHLRPEKDPFRTALALRHLPASSRIRVLHAGRALSPDMRKRAHKESLRNRRYRWLGELPHARARRLLAASHLTVLSSQMEGSSNVLSEALVFSVPVLASRIPGLMGTLGEDYLGYFPVGETRALAQLLWRAETDQNFYRSLKRHIHRLRPLARSHREGAAWAALLKNLAS